ncbi:fumarylacetoacetate hydrolase family protein [Sphingomonas oligoaromativorans]|jgi:fumarylacetoacetate (FAA) hydrolase family protein|uniref:fumarylacetoacetate hydrolase family protein n=1 Tax=Sphingomonas oligoaromativorans TaxID=575322 RepID=UPI0014237977|nr:fumarylacetoacetate hydrolase family protein [Sphingomonas oligoaromativorans]NIJ33946.1 fumarylacetoacetate (FAA) hydrolase family protein [Sphingomonas oligoaromativorans]
MTGKAFVAAEALPEDWRAGLFLGRIDLGEGPTPVLVSGGIAYDMTAVAATVSELVALKAFDPSAGKPLGDLETLGLSAAVDAPHRLLSPIDLQCVKAAGVTFAVSALERVIEERARGDSSAAAEVRSRIETRIGGGIRTVKPGSPEAATLKATLIEEGMWSQYLEVAIGPDAEIFTKSPVLSTVGWGALIGVRSDSTWNNPEPEVVLLADSHGTAVGATLGNDVNLRDFEGRSALLLSKAKDNTASCAIGPFVRLFDASFSMDDVRTAKIDLLIEGEEGYVLNGTSTMSEISRDPEDLLAQAMSEHHYPDGYTLFLGTLFAPIQDRDEPGRGFTHKLGDVVTISTPKLGRLVNRVTTSKAAPAWTLGIAGLMRNLAGRGLLVRA